MSELVSFTKDGNVGVITVNNPPVNALSPGVPEGILASLQAAEKDNAIQAVILIGGGRTFIAGADIKECATANAGPPRRTRDLEGKLKDKAACLAALAKVREVVAKKARGLMAPMKAIDAIEAAVKLPFGEGLRKEAELFKECLFSDQSKALIH